MRIRSYKINAGETRNAEKVNDSERGLNLNF